MKIFRPLAALCVSSVFLVSGGVLAAAREPGVEIYPASDQEVTDTLARINSTGSVTATDRMTMLSRPDVTTGMVDPSSAEVDGLPDVVDSADLGAIGNASSAFATRTASADRYISYKDWFGNSVVKYHFTIAWNYNGKKVIGAPTRGHYIRAGATQVGTIYDRGLTENSAAAHYPGPNSYVVSMQAQWEQCFIRYGCVWTSYPYTKFTVNAKGGYAIVQSY